MTTPPPCHRLGRQCRELRVIASVASLQDDRPPARDALATWLLGHTERISFGAPRLAGQRVVVDAVVHVPCKYLQETGAGRARCAAHGFAGPLPSGTQPARPATRQHGDETVSIVHRGRLRRLELPHPPAPRRTLPVLDGGNPCAGAPCRTADNTRGAACCRDLTLEVIAPAEQKRSDGLEALLRARRAPYLCKVERADADILECEVISACGYLAADGISCVLHGRKRPDGRPAKPRVCSRWPDLGPDDVGHPGCVLLPTHKRKK